MNEAWKTADAEAHEAKAEALGIALAALAGIVDAVDNVERVVIVNAMSMLQLVRRRHEEAARLAGVV